MDEEPKVRVSCRKPASKEDSLKASHDNFRVSEIICRHPSYSSKIGKSKNFGSLGNLVRPRKGSGNV